MCEHLAYPPVQKVPGQAVPDCLFQHIPSFPRLTSSQQPLAPARGTQMGANREQSAGQRMGTAWFGAELRQGMEGSAAGAPFRLRGSPSAPCGAPTAPAACLGARGSQVPPAWFFWATHIPLRPGGASGCRALRRAQDSAMLQAAGSVPSGLWSGRERGVLVLSSSDHRGLRGLLSSERIPGRQQVVI